MKLFHLSDLHIGKRVNEFSMLEDQKYILMQILKAAKEHQPDGIILAGDIYDKPVPAAEAVQVFDDFLTSLNEMGLIVFMISGNHDSPERVSYGGRLMKKSGIYVAPVYEGKTEKVEFTDAYGKVCIHLLPFVKPSMVKQVVGTDENGNNLSYNETLRRLIGRENINQDERNVLVSHQFYLPVGKKVEEIERMDSEIRTVGNIDEVSADVLEIFDYAALGHIHKPMKLGNENWRYCGTPLACSVSEAQQQKGIIMIEMGVKGEVETTVLPLYPLHQVRVIKGELEEILAEKSQDYVTVILTDKKDLDVIDMQERIRLAFPNLLEIRRENQRKADYARALKSETLMNPYELCCSFLKNMDEKEKEILQDVIHTVQEVK